MQIEIYGVPEDQTKRRSSVIKSNGEPGSCSLDYEQRVIICYEELDLSHPELLLNTYGGWNHFSKDQDLLAQSAAEIHAMCHFCRLLG